MCLQTCSTEKESDRRGYQTKPPRFSHTQPPGIRRQCLWIECLAHDNMLAWCVHGMVSMQQQVPGKVHSPVTLCNCESKLLSGVMPPQLTASTMKQHASKHGGAGIATSMCAQQVPADKATPAGVAAIKINTHSTLPSDNRSDPNA